MKHGYKAIPLFLAVICLFFFTACGQSENGGPDRNADTPLPETGVHASAVPETPGPETAPESEEGPSSGEEAGTDYTVDGWLSAHAEEEPEEALIALLKARSELVKEKALGGWYTLKTDSITVTGKDLSFEITDGETIKRIGELLSPEKLRACVAHPEITKAGGKSAALLEETYAYSGFSGGDFLLLDLENGVFIGVLFDPGDTERGVTEVRIGPAGEWVDGMVEIPVDADPEIPFLYLPGSYSTGREIEYLLNDLTGALS